jgi:hypothetical protein
VTGATGATGFVASQRIDHIGAREGLIQINERALRALPNSCSASLVI